MGALFTIPNATLVALAQAGVIVAATLGAAVGDKVAGQEGTYWLTSLFVNWGLALLAIPLGWLAVALLVRRHPGLPDGVKGLAFACGILLIATFAVSGYFAFTRPMTMTPGIGLEDR